MTRAFGPSMMASSGGTLDPNAELRTLVQQIQAEQLTMQIFMQKMVEESRLIRRATAVSNLGFGLPFMFGDGCDGDTTISAPTGNQIDIEIAGADDFVFTANTFTAASGSTIAIAAGGAITNAGSMAPDISSTGKAMILGF